MTTTSIPLAVLVLTGVGAPALLFALLGGSGLIKWAPSEKATGRLAGFALSISFVALFAAWLSHPVGPGMHFLAYGGWSHPGGIALEFLTDPLSLAFAALSAAILGIVSAFSHRYLHLDPGYHRYFVLLAMFATGMQLIALAGNIEVLFVGWEFVGLSSALLIAFFHQRPAPVSNGMRVFSVYRISDAAMLAAAVLLRHLAGNDSLAILFGGGGGAAAGLSQAGATAIAVLLIIAVAGKSALIPFSDWLPRAMEGPTPSSAVYYGALSIHAGCFLLIRAMPLLAHAPAARIFAGLLGAATAAFAALATRVQSDIKSSLAYASLTQVGLIVVEIALGWRLLAFVHLAGHVCFRLLQLLSAPNVLHAYHDVPDRAEAEGRGRVASSLYLFALERGFLDHFLDNLTLRPLGNLARKLSRMDAWLCGALLPPLSAPSTEDGDDD